MKGASLPRDVAVTSRLINAVFVLGAGAIASGAAIAGHAAAWPYLFLTMKVALLLVGAAGFLLMAVGAGLLMWLAVDVGAL